MSKRVCRVWVASESPDDKMCRPALDAIRSCDALRMLGPWKVPNTLPSNECLNLKYVRKRFQECVDVLVCVFNNDCEAHDEWLHALGGMAFALRMPVYVYVTPTQPPYTPYATEVFKHGNVNGLITRLKQCTSHLPQIDLPRMEGWYQECIDDTLGGWWHVTHSKDPPPDDVMQQASPSKRIKSSK